MSSLTGEFRKPGRGCPGRERNQRVMQLTPVQRDSGREGGIQPEEPGADMLLQERRGAGSLWHFLYRHQAAISTLPDGMYAWSRED